MGSSSTRLEVAQQALQSRLEGALRGSQLEAAAAVVGQRGESCWAVFDGTKPRHPQPSTFLVKTGCVTKIFTAMLVLDAVDSGDASLDDSAADLVRCAHGDILAGVTVRHLLEHTHGLDHSGLAHAPLRENGQIDADALLAHVARPRRRGAGELYSYSDVGPWLAAAILERLWDMTFADALFFRLFEPACITFREAHRREPSSVCPSRGRDLALSLVDLVRLLESALERPQTWPSAGDEAATVTPLPGWDLLERGVHLGWKYFGESWYGHNSVVPGESLVVRVHPPTRGLIVVASRDRPATFLAAKIFGRALPELRSMTIPKPLAPQEAARLDLARYCGRYLAGSEQVTIAMEDGRLELRSDDRRAPLVPAAHHLFFVLPTGTRPGYVQLLRPGDGRFRYLWDGQRVFANVDWPGAASA